MKATKTNAANQMDKTVAAIAKQILDLETLAAQNRDRLDFYDLSVGSIKRALEAAYEAGRAAK